MEELIPSKQRGYEAVGFLKPNGHAKQVLNSYNIKKENLNKYDFLVISGTNDVAANDARNALDAMSKYLDTYTNLKYTYTNTNLYLLIYLQDTI